MMENREISGQFDENEGYSQQVQEFHPKLSIRDSNITNCNVTQHFFVPSGEKQYSTTGTTQDEPKEKKSITNFRKPISHFVETNAYSRIYQYLKENNIVILHCHGFSGRGKSETVRNLAKDFPFSDLEQQQQQEYFVKWHIECDDKDQDIKREIKELVAQTRKHLGFPLHHQDVLNDIENDKAASIVQALIGSCIPVLLIIEMNKFKTEQQQQFVEDLLRSIEEDSKCQNYTTKLHVYLTSQSKSAFLKEEEQSRMKCYRLENITGFDESEGVDFLMNENKEENSERECALLVYKFFSGSPLGLSIAKSVCKKDRIGYSDYLQMIKDEEINIFHSQDENFNENSDDNELKMFKAITMPFRTETKEANKPASLELQVLSCLSYFHHDRIPRFLIERCFEVLRNYFPIKPYQNKRDSGRLITKLCNYEMCLLENVDNVEYVTLHELVLHAFRIPQQTCSEKKKKHLLNAIIVVAGLLGKDLREKDFLNKMTSLLRHALEVIDHLEKQKNVLNDDDHLMKAVIVHLFEMAGAITLTNHIFKQMSDKYFKKAIELMWKDKEYSLTDPLHSKDDVNEVAEYVITQSDVEEHKLPKSFITEFESKIMFIPGENQLNGLQKKCKNTEKFENVRKAIESGDSKKNVISLLRECGNVYLDEKLHQQIHFVERLASILHSWSRVILYKEQDPSIPDDYYLWISSLSNALSVKCREKYGVALLTEEISSTTGRIPLILRMKSGATPELFKAKEFCENALKPEIENPNKKFYEHGLLKNVNPTSDSQVRMRMLRNLMRIYTRLLKSGSDAKEVIIIEGEKVCQELFRFASDNTEKLSNAPMWIIRCAKFYAGSENFDLAFDCFTMYFEKKESEKVSFHQNAWAINNYARAVLCGNRISELPKAIREVKTVLETDEVMGSYLDRNLKEKLVELELLSQTTTTLQQ